MKPRLLDLFCKAGGAAMGYHMAGFEVVGVDIENQPNYPFEFHRADAMNYPLSGFDVVHASPPCQGYSITRHTSKSDEPLLISPLRDILEAWGGAWVMENVEGAKWDMVNPIRLCGSSFGLRVRRHRLFETSIRVPAPACAHEWQDSHRPYLKHMSRTRGYEAKVGTVGVYGGNQFVGGRELFYKSVAMGIDWMTAAELNQAIPPAYTRMIGESIRADL